MSSRRDYWVQKLASRNTGYPVATIACFGEDDQFASKVEVAIVSGPDEEPTALKKWFAEGIDVRYDVQTQKEMAEFILMHNSRRVAMVDRIIGCPHEEGIDYPDGGVCPHCPFWANHERWNG